MGMSFGAGKLTDRFHSPPAIVETLPGDEAAVTANSTREFGTSEDKLIDYLAGEQFMPQWRRGNDANSSSFVADGLICRKIARVLWRAGAAGVLTEVRGAYESHCL